MTTVALRNLLALPGPERRTEIEAMIVAEFRAALQMESGEPLPMDAPYFDLGITSLRLVEARKRLEERLGIAISSNVMFNQPTLTQLIAYLADEALPAAIYPARSPQARDKREGRDAEVDELALVAAILPELNEP